MTMDLKETYIPRLDLRLPVVAGVLAVLAFCVAGLGGAAFVPIEKGVGTSGKIVSEAQTKPVAHLRGGSIADLNVADGQHVAMGDVLMTLDTQALQEQIGALKAQSEAAFHQLELVRAEAATVANLIERKLAQKSRLQQIEQQVQEVGKEAAGLSSRIALVQAEIDKSALRAPIAGRIVSLAVAGRGTVVEAGTTALEIAPDEDRLVIEGRLTPAQAAGIKPGVPAKVWLTASNWRDQRPLAAKLSWISAASLDDKRTGQPYFLARVELDDARAEINKSFTLQPGMRAEILLVTGQLTLLSELIDPFMRSVHKAIRG